MTNNGAAYRIMHRWSVVQHELLSELEACWGGLTAKLEPVIHILEWVRIEEHLGDERIGHIRRDGAAIEARERPRSGNEPATTGPSAEQPSSAAPEGTGRGHRRGRMRRAEPRQPVAQSSPLARQRTQTLAEPDGRGLLRP